MALWGGSSIAWESLTDINYGYSFCDNCDFNDSSKLGYQTLEGLATCKYKRSILKMNYNSQKTILDPWVTETVVSCPTNVLLDHSGFPMEVAVVDEFQTKVSGRIIEESSLQIELASSCISGSLRAPINRTTGNLTITPTPNVYI